MKHVEDDGWVSTLNNMGYMSLSIDPFTEKFIDYCESNPGLCVFEGGAAYGVATHLALKKGAFVTANDSEPRHLDLLYEHAPQEFLHALNLASGKLPYDLDFPNGTYDAIYSSRMLHFLTGEEVEICMGKFFNWLKEGGKIFIVAESPYLGCYSSFIPIYEERKKRGDPWPGLIEDTSPFKSIRHNNIPNFLNFFDADIFKRVSEKTGFIVEKCELIDRKDFPREVRYDGRESVGLIAMKPLTYV